MSKKLICPSILSADFSELKNQIHKAEKGGADIIHCDIMDGNFVPNISFGPKIVSDVNNITEIPLDVHLMINDPGNFIDEFCKAGADFISVHYENNDHLNRTIFQIKDKGIKAGVVLNPATPVFMLEDIIYYADYVLIMSVNPGFGGQKFIPKCITKLKQLRELINSANPDCLIEIDGGVGPDNIKEISDAGADMFVCGSSVFSTPDITESVKNLKSIIS
ncbi:MAG TPA: ribulose-phosphate 3-epimerase [Ignavibacteria bacterium]|nr:ribulose-phosphate 3-epimerase [Ignavibacteria bacterium]HMR40758.1 ribulose-phosphate 3-epimerase [Ignavibacteria bacterium]